MDKNQQIHEESLEQQLEAQLSPPVKEEKEPENGSNPGKVEKPCAEDQDMRTLRVGDWMLTILFYIIPVLNIVMMAVWSFSSKGNVHRRNLSRACLLWVIILLIAYVVAMTVAGLTILDIFQNT